jgi:hypothetical protein
MAERHSYQQTNNINEKQIKSCYLTIKTSSLDGNRAMDIYKQCYPFIAVS